MSLWCDGTSYDGTWDEHSWIAVIEFRLIRRRFLCYRETTFFWREEILLEDEAWKFRIMLKQGNLHKLAIKKKRQNDRCVTVEEAVVLFFKQIQSLDGRRVSELKSCFNSEVGFCRNACIDTDGWGYAKNAQMVFRNVSHVLVDVSQ